MRYDHRKTTDLAEYKTYADNMIDEAAGRARTRYITTVAGQSETYTAKAENAKAFKADPSPNIDNYPWVKAEATARGVSGGDAATLIDDTATQWVVLGSTIEQYRIAGKVNVESQLTVEDIINEYKAAVALLDGI